MSRPLNRIGLRSGAAVLAALLVVSMSGAISQQAQAAGTTTPGANPSSTPSTTGASGYAGLRPAPDDGHLKVLLASPDGKLRSLDQATEIRWVFDRPVADLGARAEQVDASKFVTITPAVPGAFRWASSRTLVFTPDEALQPSTAYTVTLAGLTGLDGSTLTAPSKLSITTPTVVCALKDVDEADSVIRDNSVISLSCDQPVDLNSLAAKVQLEVIPRSLKAAAFTPSAADLAEMRKLDPTGTTRLEGFLRALSTRTKSVVGVKAVDSGPCSSDAPEVCYRLTPVAPVGTDANVRIRVMAGLASLAGSLPGAAHLVGRVPTPSTLLLRSDTCATGCDPDGSSLVSVEGGEVSPEVADGAITVADLTSPGPVKTFDANDDSQSSEPLALRWAGLVPGHRYRVTLQAAALGATWVRTFTLGHRANFARLPGGENVVESGVQAAAKPALRINVRNVTEFQQVRVRLDDKQIVGIVRSFEEVNGTKPVDPTTFDSTRVQVRIPADSERRARVELDQPGVWFVAMKPTGTVAGSTYSDDGFPVRNTATTTTKKKVDLSQWQTSLVQLTDMGITVKRSPANVLVAVTSLGTAKPVAKAAVELFGSGRLVWTGTTDAQGVALVDAADLKGCGQACDLVAVVRSGELLAYASAAWREWGNDLPYVDQTEEGDSATTSKPAVPALPPGRSWTSALFTDRGVYKLGEQVHLKGLLRIETPTGLDLPGTQVRTLTPQVTDDRGVNIPVKSVPVGPKGDFELAFTLPADGNQGSYSVQLDGIRGYTSFIVASFRKPDFKVDVVPTRPSWVSGESITATVEGRYLFGAAMDGRGATWVARRSPTFVDPSSDHPELRLDGFRWAPYCIEYSDCSEEYGVEMAKGDTKLGADGTLAVSVPVPVNPKVHGAAEVTIESEVTDVNRQAIANRDTVIVHPGDYYVGVRLDRSFVSKGTPIAAKFAALTPDGKWVPGKALTAQLVRWDWVRAKRQAGDSSVVSGAWVPTIESTQQLTSASAPVTATFTAGRTGTYEVRVSSTDGRGNLVQSGTDAYVTGPGYVPWYDPSVAGDERSVTLLQERSTYAPGETARILIQSPWPTAEALVTTERGSVLTARRISITGSAATLDVPVTAQDVPNVFVAVTLYKGRTGAPDGKDDAGRPMVKEGSIELKVRPTDRTLGVKVTVPNAEERPGAKTTASVVVTGPDGKPSTATVTLWAVDEGVLRLSGYTLPDLIEQLIPERYDEVVTSDSRMRLVALEQLSAAKAAGDEKGDSLASAPSYVDPGGGGGDESTVDGVRRDFRTLAGWAGAVQIDATGKADVPIALPESLSEFRVMAVAADGADRFGGGTSSVRVAQPFSVVPSLPRFLENGDTAELSVVVQNRTGAPGSATVTLDPGVGSNLKLLGSGSQTLTVPVGPTEVRFPVQATALGTVKVIVKGTFDAPASGTAAAVKEQDGAQVSLPVTLITRIEATTGAGEVQGGSFVTEQLAVPKQIEPGVGGLEVTTASTALVGLQNGISNLVEYPYGCLEQRSSRVKVLLNLKALGDQYALGSLPMAKLDSTVRAELAKFKDYRTSDGGLSYWPGDDRSDPFLTARVLSLLVDAKALGYKAPAGMENELTSYLQSQIDRFGDVGSDDQEDGLWWGRAEILAALAKVGRFEPKLNLSLYKNRADLSLDEQVALMHSMLVGGQTGTEAQTLLRELRNTILVEGDQAYAQSDGLSSVCPCLSWLYADRTHLTADLLSLLLKIDPMEPLAPKMARWLLAQRSNGTWRNTYEDGAALSALVTYGRTQESVTPAFTAQVLVGATKVVDEQFSGRQLTARTATVPMAQLTAAATAAAGKLPVKVSADGTGRLSYSLRLRYAPAVATLKPVDAGFTVERSYLPYQAKTSTTSSTAAAGSAKVVPGTRRTTTTVAKADRAGAAARGNNGASFKAGDLVVVRLRITTTQLRENVVIEDPLPAGFEALDARLASTSQEATSAEDSNVPSWYSGIDHVEIRDDRVLLFATFLEDGTLVYTYVARATSPGSFTVAPTQASEMYRPEIFGRGGTVNVKVTAPTAG